MVSCAKLRVRQPHCAVQSPDREAVWRVAVASWSRSVKSLYTSSPVSTWMDNRLGMLAPTRSTQPGHPFASRCIEFQRKLGTEVTVGLSSHWPRVTDSLHSSPTNSTVQDRETSPLRSFACDTTLYLTHDCRANTGLTMLWSLYHLG